MRSKYFKIQELVSPELYKEKGDMCWLFIDRNLIITLDTLREFFDAPITVNNWLYGGNLKQRGLRANKDQIVVDKKRYYVSQHCLGKAVDINVKGFTPEEVYDKIIKHHNKFPYITRIENINNTPTWTHIDCANTDSDELVIFNA